MESKQVDKYPDQVTHTIWCAPIAGGLTCRVTITAPTNAECLEIARANWDYLAQSGYEMKNARP